MPNISSAKISIIRYVINILICKRKADLWHIPYTPFIDISQISSMVKIHDHMYFQEVDKIAPEVPTRH